MLLPFSSGTHRLPPPSKAIVSRCSNAFKLIPKTGSTLLFPAVRLVICAWVYLKTSPAPPLPLGETPSSTTHRLPAESKRRCEGELNPPTELRIILGVGFPLAANCAGVYSTITCPSSAPTHMFPDESNASPSGPLRLLPVSSEMTTVGVGTCFFNFLICFDVYMNIELALKLVTQRLPPLNATVEGPSRSLVSFSCRWGFLSLP